MAGQLILCATPIGNLEDISMRALRVMREADVIAAEDTRNSIRLLNHFDIHTPMTSYHEYNKYDKGRTLVKRMLAGETVVLITDAGTPGISDPGEELAAMAWEAGIRVTAIPGPAAVVTALTISGLPTGRFAFEAFLPRDKKERRTILEELKEETRTIVLYEAPHRLRKTLSELTETLGGSRRISLCRELTKVHETVLRMTLQEAEALYEREEPRGEYVLVLEGRPRAEMVQEEQAQWKSMPLEAHMDLYTQKGFSRREAMKMVAADRGMRKREIYQALLETDKKDS